MKLKCFVLLIFLDVCGPSLAVSSINESEVESYSVTRRTNTPELFTVKMKDGHDCAPDGQVWRWCKSLSAHLHSAWENRSSCSCSCDNTIPLSFLPALQTCINASVADNFGGCDSCFEPGRAPALQTPVDLQTRDSKETCINSTDYKCTLHGEFFDYNGFQPRWENINGIFSLRKINGKFSIKWKQHTAGKLSGRIIRFNFSCSKKTGQAPKMSRCMLMKALGTVTYLSGSLTQSSYPAVPTSIPSGFSNLVSTGILNTIISTSYSIEPSKSSLAAEASSRSDVIDGPGKKNARTSGNVNGTVIGAAVGGAIVFGIFIIVILVLCKQTKLGNGKDKPTKRQVENATYGSSDMPLSSATEKPVTTSMEQDSQPTYQDLITDNALYSNPDDDDYDNYNAYQSPDKKVPGCPVYQGLMKGQLDTGKPTLKSKPRITGPPGERHDDTAEPVYNVLEQPDTEQGTMPEKASGDGDEHTQSEPVYNVLDGSDSEENYDAGDSLYNVLEEPESTEDHQQPLYNVLESSDAEKSSHQGAQGSCGLSNEPLYNVVEGPDSDELSKCGVGYDGSNGSSSSGGHDNPAYEESLNFGPTESGVGCAAPNGSSSPDAHDNPGYEQSLDFDVPYASVQRPGS